MATHPEIPFPPVRFSTPDLSRRTPPSALPELMDGPCTRAELRACLRDLAWINRVLLGYRPILTWLSQLRPQINSLTSQSTCHPDDQREEGPAVALRDTSFAPDPRTTDEPWSLVPCPSSPPSSLPLRILDIGSGYGDTLREISAWARRRNLPVELTGLDLNPETTAIATEVTSDPSIRFVTADAFTYTPSQPPHLIVSSLLTHHLEDVEIVRLLTWMEANATVGWFINDLSRHPTPYHLFRWFSRAVHLHPFVQHDGPVSFARAFQPEDWQHYCAAAGLLPGEVEIRGFTPGRLCVSRIKKQGACNAAP